MIRLYEMCKSFHLSIISDIPYIDHHYDDAEDDEPHGLHAGQYCAGVRLS